jgi:hypothetical protein
MRLLIRVAILPAIFAALFCAAQEQVKLDHPVKHIAGVVQRVDGEPLPNIDVEVFAGRVIVAATKTNSHGKFSTDSLEAGDYEVWFTYKPHPVFKDVIYKLTVSPKGSKEPIVVKMPVL